MLLTIYNNQPNQVEVDIFSRDITNDNAPWVQNAKEYLQPDGRVSRNFGNNTQVSLWIPWTFRSPRAYEYKFFVTASSDSVKDIYVSQIYQHPWDQLSIPEWAKQFPSYWNTGLQKFKSFFTG